MIEEYKNVHVKLCWVQIIHHYDEALKTCNIERTYGEKLCFDFALSLEKHEHCSLWLPDQRSVNFNLRNVQKYSQFNCNTSTVVDFKKSALTYFVRILNEHYSH